MRPHERQDEIVRLVHELGEISVDELSARLDISRETVRRDLTALDAIGKVHKFHGGARLPHVQQAEPTIEGPFAARLSENYAAKAQIAATAARLLAPGDSLFLDTGTTTLAFAEALVPLPQLTIITNSTKIATISASGGNHRVFLIGGAFSADASETVGAIAVEQIHRFRARHAFLTVGALDASGLLDYDEHETQIAKAMIERVESVTVLADMSKFSRRGIFEVAPWSRVARVVSDGLPPEAVRQAMEVAGVQHILAEAGA